MNKHGKDMVLWSFLVECFIQRIFCSQAYIFLCCTNISSLKGQFQILVSKPCACILVTHDIMVTYDIKHSCLFVQIRFHMFTYMSELQSFTLQIIYLLEGRYTTEALRLLINLFSRKICSLFWFTSKCNYF